MLKKAGRVQSVLKVVVGIVLFGSVATSAFAMQPNDVKQYTATGSCPNCDLSMGILSLTGNGYRNSNLQQADLVLTVMQSATPGSSLQLDNSNFTQAIGTGGAFVNDDLHGTNFAGGIFEDTNFSAANLSNTDFTGADLKGAILDEANLYGSNISDAQMGEARRMCGATLPNGQIEHICKP
jgi:uncharacterized protein YjbI with pentapeptide repeats